jgi:DNA-directed RNA polymerase specialized sigma24 family protein
MRMHARGLGPRDDTRGGALSERSADDEARTPRASELLREHGPALTRVCMALLGDAASAERALERVAREAGAATLDASTSPVVHLMRLARRACANQLSKLPVRHTASFGVDEPKAVPAREPESEHAAVARASLGRLKPTEREAVVMHLVGGLDAAQIAEVCEVDLTTTRQRIARGVAQLVEEERHR